jgi:4-carboxymuconolactone decarboxylase
LKNIDQTTRYERGLARLAEVDGEAGERIVAALGDLGRYIVEFAFGDIYTREGMSLREREIATVAVLTALGGREPQLRVHMEAALHVGISLQEIEEIILQTIPYAGFPTAINAMNLLLKLKVERQTQEEM